MVDALAGAAVEALAGAGVGAAGSRACAGRVAGTVVQAVSKAESVNGNSRFG